MTKFMTAEKLILNYFDFEFLLLGGITENFRPGFSKT